MACPDGTSVTGRIEDLASWSDAALAGLLPSYGYLSGATYDFSLTGTGDPSTGITVFSCGAGNAGGTPRYNDCAITGGTGMFPPSLCVDYTGSGNTGFTHGDVAISASKA